MVKDAMHHLFPPAVVCTPTTRLGLEWLESREVPVARPFYWAPEVVPPPVGGPPTSPPAFIVTNFLKGDGIPYDRYAATDPLPGPEDSLYYTGGLSTADRVIPAQAVTSGNAFAAIHLIYGYAQPVPTTGELPPPTSPPPPTTTPVWTGYTGTVTTSYSFAVGTLEVDCGQISQGSVYAPSGNGSTLTVNSFLDWTGGTLNSNTVAGTIALAPGATGVAEPSFTNPGINQTVGLGSNIELLGPPVSENTGGGSSLDVLSGKYNIANNAGFVVNNQCSLRFLPDPDDAPRGGDGGGNPQPLIADVQLSDTGTEKTKAGGVTVEKSGLATFKPRERPTNSTTPARYKSDGYLLNDGGTVKIIDTTELQFSGTTTSTNGFVYSVRQPATQPEGTFQVEGGCRVMTKNGTGISGKFEILTATRDPITQNVATFGLLDGSTAAYALTFAAGVLSMPTGQVRGLQVEGNFAWAGGTIQLYMSATVDKSSDWIKVVDGNLSISNTPKLKLTWTEAEMRQRLKDDIWHLIKVTGTGKEITGNYTFDYADDKLYCVDICIWRRPGAKLPKSQRHDEDRDYLGRSILNDIDNDEDVNDDDIAKAFPARTPYGPGDQGQRAGLNREYQKKLDTIREKPKKEKDGKDLKAPPPEKK